MKKTLFYAAITALLGICLFLVLHKHKEMLMPATEMLINHEAKITNNAEPSPSTSTKHVSKSAFEQVEPVMTNEMQHKVESLSNAVQNYATQVNGRIEFYGIVIDENNRPIEGANVEFVRAQMWPLPEGTPTTNVLTDAEGLFSLTGVFGMSLGVHVSKVGYDTVKNLNIDRFNYNTLPGSTLFQPDSNNPVLFHLRKSQ